MRSSLISINPSNTNKQLNILCVSTTNQIYTKIQRDIDQIYLDYKDCPENERPPDLEFFYHNGDDLESYDISKFDSILATCIEDLDQDILGNFLDRCSKQGKTVVLMAKSNYIGAKFPKGSFQGPFIPGMKLCEYSGDLIPSDDHNEIIVNHRMKVKSRWNV